MRSLPPELLDLIVDLLHDQPDALKACCAVSTSWVRRSRKHLFARIEFSLLKSHIERWKEAFPDPSQSPTRYTRSLLIRGLPVITTADTGSAGWIHTFSNVVRLHVDTIVGDDFSLVPFRGLSPTLKSLILAYKSSTPPSEVFGLVCSFPLLEDLALISLGNYNEVGGWSAPSTSPKLTGSLDLRILGGIRSTVRRLLELPGGPHFTKITVSCLDEDVESTMSLLSRCSDTLESLSVCYYLPVTSSPPVLDLSKLTNLKTVAFGCNGPSVEWITTTLKTAESTNFQKVAIHSLRGFRDLIGEAVYQEWQDLDRVLLQSWNERPIRLKIRYKVGEGGNDLRALAPRLLPELTSRGVVDLVED